MLVKQRKENKPSTTFKDTLYKVTSTYSNKVTVTSHEGVNYNITKVKRYLKATDGQDQQGTQDGLTSGIAYARFQQINKKTK